jgi:hypothetical protein
VRILFLCASLEPGRDGVGDYTARLAGELRLRGHDCLCAAIDDRHLEQGVGEKGFLGGSGFPRLSPQKSWSGRMGILREEASEFQPDWVSLQFVPYGFDPKGVPFLLPGRLGSIRGGFRWHVMFHELWYGEAKGSSFKESLVCLLQRSIVRRLLVKLQPLQVHTHIGLFMERLRGLGARPVLLPLFGNIPVVESPPEPWGEVCPALMSGAKRTLKCGVFGSVAPGSLPGSVLSIIGEAARQRGAEAIFIHFGEPGGSRGRNAWDDAMRKLPEGAKAIVLGPLTAGRISAILQHLDLGIATTPPSALGKSGTFAAMREHGLPVIACAPDFFPIPEKAPGSFPATRQGLGEALSMPRVKDANAPGKVARQFAADLERAAAGATGK